LASRTEFCDTNKTTKAIRSSASSQLIKEEREKREEKKREEQTSKKNENSSRRRERTYEERMCLESTNGMTGAGSLRSRLKGTEISRVSKSSNNASDVPRLSCKSDDEDDEEDEEEEEEEEEDDDEDDDEERFGRVEKDFG